MIQDKLIVALDHDDLSSMQQLVYDLNNALGIINFKIGLRALLALGADNAITSVDINNGKIFLDLKIFDTQDTVQKAVESVAQIVDMISVFPDRKIIEAALRGTRGSSCKILAVAQLSDHNNITYSPEYLFKCGADGIIAPAWLVRALKHNTPPLMWGNKIFASPGIRMMSSDSAITDCHQPKNVATPAEAIRWGVDYIVVGRPIINAKDPIEAAKRIIEDMERGAQCEEEE